MSFAASLVNSQMNITDCDDDATNSPVATAVYSLVVLLLCAAKAGKGKILRLYHFYSRPMQIGRLRLRQWGAAKTMVRTRRLNRWSRRRGQPNCFRSGIITAAPSWSWSRCEVSEAHMYFCVCCFWCLEVRKVWYVVIPHDASWYVVIPLDTSWYVVDTSCPLWWHIRDWHQKILANMLVKYSYVFHLKVRCSWKDTLFHRSSKRYTLRESHYLCANKKSWCFQGSSTMHIYTEWRW